MIKNRLHNFLAKIAGSSEAAELTPENELEYWLNEIAKNGGGGGLVVTGSMIVDSVSTLDKTYAEIEAAILAATPVTVIVNTASSQEYNHQYVSNNLTIYLYDGVYYVVVNVGVETQYAYVCDDKTEYPSMGFD